jgi:uncharacterized membrane protein YphA (DoxX/SURF4 family)
MILNRQNDGISLLKKEMRIKHLLLLASTLFLGGFMIYGGLGKFVKPNPQPTDKIHEVEAIGVEESLTNDHLQISNFIFGLKQTHYFWQFLGICEILVGLLLLSQIFAFPGALMAVPITINIFLFHLFLEFHELGELVLTLMLFVANLYILFFYFNKWKGLFRDPDIIDGYKQAIGFRPSK